jgi:integrase
LFKDSAKEQPCATVAEAVAAFGDLKSEKRKGKLAKVGQTPLFADFKFHDEVRQAGTQGAKRESTTMRERGPLDLWKDHLSGVRIHRIQRRHIQTFIEDRQKAGMTGRTINYDLIALRNVLKRALDQDLIAELPTKNFKPLKHIPPKRELVSADEINQLCDKAMKGSKDGQQFSDYVKLMAYCGSRRDETLRLKWSDVDWKRNQLIVGSDGLAKNHKARGVDFNPALEAT